eukprot:augustus_masked-scaffold_15-processed-gene-3.40-mRNA-1 protein AED:0.01 eAED:0.02 QI:0/-1/0/1/-1/1/1/0/1759
MAPQPPMTQQRPMAYTWQNPARDASIRQDMIARIISLLKQRKPDARQDWINKLPEMAKKLEDKLYMYSRTQGAYQDTSTLTHRLQRIAMEITHDRQTAKKNSGRQSIPGHSMSGPGGPQPGSRHSPQPGSQMHDPMGAGRPVSANHLTPMHPSTQNPPNSNPAMNQLPPRPGSRDPMRGTPTRMHRMQHSGNPPSGMSSPHNMRGSIPPSHGHGQMPFPNAPGSRPASSLGQSQGQRRPPSQPLSQSRPTEMIGSQQRQQAQQRQAVLRQQQQRLLLLRHASRCPYNEGSCSATPYCAQYKKLWLHIASCRDQQCDTPHCVSSRYVLSHYHRCQEKTCAVCGPVREAIEKHNRLKLAHGRNQPPGPGTPRGEGAMLRQVPSMGTMSTQQGHTPGLGGGAAYQRPPSTGMHRRLASYSGSQTGAPPPGASPQDPRGIGGQYGRPGFSSVNSYPSMPPTTSPAFGNNTNRPPSVPVRNTSSPYPAPPVPSVEPNMPPTQNTVSNTIPRAQPPGSMLAPPTPGAMPYQAPPQVPSPATAEPQNDVERELQELERKRREAEEEQRRKQQEQRELEERINRLKSKAQGAQPPPRTQPQPAAPPPAGPSGVNTARPASLPPAKKSRGPDGAVPTQQTTESGTLVRKSSAAHNPLTIIAAQGSQSSLVYSFTIEEIEQHVKSLHMHSLSMKTSEVRQKALIIWKKLEDQDNSWIFAKPVDPEQLDIPDYFDVIKRPMDMGTIKKRLDGNQYRDLRSFAKDVRLVYNNAMIYNPESSDVHGIARKYGYLFEKEYYTMQNELREEEARNRRNENACKLCGGCKYIFEPPVYYCNGKCNQKIRRAAYFYSTPDNKQFYCLSCFNSYLKQSVLLEDGSTVQKDQLAKKKNDEVQEESWVECSQCKRWFHQVCALFNGRRNDQSAKNDPYFCPMCVLKHVERIKTPHEPPKSKISAKSLPESQYSKYLQAQVLKRILKERRDKAHKERLPLSQIPDCGEINIRVVSCKDAELFPRAGLAALYKDKYPTSFPHRVKCVLLFEKRDGVDCLILGMYTQVYGSDCPEPNARSLYIAYLDSVYYFTPGFVRTAVYHEMIVATMEYEKRRGITKAFIWVCPPLAGDDYILYCHPKDQRTPKAEMLRNWYFKLLEESRKRGITVSLDNLYDSYLHRVPNVGLVPNFEGDYWPGVSEQFIEQLRNEKIDPLSIAPRKKRSYSRSNKLSSNSKSKSSKSKLKRSKKKSKSKIMKKGGGSARKASGSVSDTEKELSPYLPPPPVQSNEVPQQDALTAKIADVIQQMKDDFIVVHMHHICSTCMKNIDQPDDIYWLPKDYDPAKMSLDYTKNRYASPYCLCNDCFQTQYEREFGQRKEDYVPKYDIPGFGEERPVIKQESWKSDPEAKPSAQVQEPKPTEPAESLSETKIKEEPVVKEETVEATPVESEMVTEVKVETPESNKLPIVVLEPGRTASKKSPWDEVPCGLKMLVPWKAAIEKDTAKMWKEDPVVDCQFFDTRQQFLFLCQGNKYQFDELRRAKHSSMMVLYHLHNPDLPSFTHTCNGCRVDITTGSRYTCNECDDFDLCENCHNSVSHQHHLALIPGSGGRKAMAHGMPQQHPYGTPYGRHDAVYQQQHRGLVEHMHLLSHSANCTLPRGQCTFRNCGRMKQLLRHGNECKMKLTGDCKVCRRVWALLHVHARNCRLSPSRCNVPNCAKLRQHFRNMQAQAQDRRIRMQTQRMQQEREQAHIQRPPSHSPQMVPSQPNHFAAKPTGSHGKYLR